ncbi:uncharacterized protein PV06_04022 [Exophiala oligosperma]|uniref:Cytochrome b561 domain-containing protein n=2 Tax=Chaetothyriales TaxID=34395 RepID=A0A0D2DT30_9EURO|nr:uncharacterized protein PV06_04022 [Exophiala oligosperma]KAJ9631177.1 hypothetical protein H2204_008262 [Knufia peltigerae]KIW45650.1 hypothetical protein PV06_04022 [Exophiala oligosperma]
MMMMHHLISLPALLAFTFFASLVSAYRPVQFVKHTGEAGRADQAFSLVNYYNETTKQSDLYVRMWAFRYQSSAKGWAALALGPQMKGALMFITYGDPATNELTLTVRTVDGHHPPRPVVEMTDFYKGAVPVVDVVSTRFDPYDGAFFHEELQQKPSHLGVAEFVVRGYEQWTAADLGVQNDTTKQSMIWSSNFKQDYDGDFAPDRNIDMHQFGLGFGFLWADLKNAASPVPFFGPINELDGHKGVNEIGDPVEPTADELKAGEGIIADQKDVAGGGVGGDDGSSTDKTPVSQPGADDGTKVEEPVKTVKQWNIRSLMWHIHGFLMTVSFLILYPLAVYFLRSSRAEAFNLHWTINSLSSVGVGVGAIVGFINSRSVSIAHQYVGILIVCALAVQTVLGWRHHVVYVSSRGGSRTWMSRVHVWLGRVVVPAGMVNVVTGLLLRHYGWLTVSLTIALAAVEVIVLTLVVGRARNRRPAARNKQPKDVPIGADEAEEYFQLGDDDDDAEFSDGDDDDGEAAAGTASGPAEERAKRDAEREEQAKRLARLDKV